MGLFWLLLIGFAAYLIYLNINGTNLYFTFFIVRDSL